MQKTAATKKMVTLSMLCAVAYVVMLVSKLLPSVNGFLDFDFKDVVLCMGGFIFGPMAAAMMAFVVAVLEMLTVSHTGPIGLLMNVVATCSFCCTASLVYKRHHTMQGAVLGLGCGCLTLTAVMLLWNYWITPFYQGVPRETVAAMLVPVFLPFNLLKGGMNMAATLLLYKPVVSALRKAHLAPPSRSNSRRHLSVGFLLFALALLVTCVLLGLVMAGIL